MSLSDPGVSATSSTPCYDVVVYERTPNPSFDKIANRPLSYCPWCRTDAATQERLALMFWCATKPANMGLTVDRKLNYRPYTSEVHVTKHDKNRRAHIMLEFDRLVGTARQITDETYDGLSQCFDPKDRAPLARVALDGVKAQGLLLGAQARLIDVLEEPASKKTEQAIGHLDHASDAVLEDLRGDAESTRVPGVYPDAEAE